MTQIDRLERDLTDWFGEIAAPSTPDYTQHIVRETRRMRQRPRWTFLERWIPMSETTLRRLAPPTVPWRTVGLVALLVLLLAAAAALWVGSRPRLPAPFGLAANGLVAYEANGDIWTVDPATGARAAIVTSADPNQGNMEPRYSLDGTQVAFMRHIAEGQNVPVILNAGGREITVADAATLGKVDPESIVWSPDGRSIAFAAAEEFYLADATTGEMRPVDVDTKGGEMSWRPPDGGQVLILGQSGSDAGIVLRDIDAGTDIAFAAPEGVTPVRLSGWTPDGSHFAYMGDSQGGVGSAATYVVDVKSGEIVSVLQAGYGQISNEGTRLVGMRADETGSSWLCVVPIDGGECAPITDKFLGGWGTDFRWSPDDQSIFLRRGEDDAMFALDPERKAPAQPAWLAEGGDTWQRVAP